MEGGELTLRIGNDKLTYRLAEAMRPSLDFDGTLYFLDTTNDIIDDCVQEILNPDPYEGWPDQEEEIQEEVHAIGLGKEEKVQPEPGELKQLKKRHKRRGRRHNKRMRKIKEKQQRSKGVSPSYGNTFSNSPSNLRKFANMCYRIVGKRVTSTYEPPRA